MPPWIQKYVLPAIVAAYVLVMSIFIAVAIYRSGDALGAAHSACEANNATNRSLVAEVDSAYARTESSTLQIIRDPHTTAERRAQLQENLDQAHATQLRIHAELAAKSC